MEQQATSDLYGSASLHERASFDISKALESSISTGIPLGHDPGDDTRGLAFELGSGGAPGHALTFGATRSGKGVNTIIPALLTYTGSVVVIDPKGENAWITGRYRSTFSRVVVLDPWNEVNERYGSQVGETITVTRFNPLSVLDPSSHDFNDDVVALADALTVASADLNSHWTDSAKELIAGLIAAAVESSPGTASLRDVRDLITAEDEKLVAAIERIQEANPNSLGARKLRRFMPKKKLDKDGQPRTVSSGSEMSSIRSTAETQTAVLDSESLLDSMETDDPPFNLSELVDGKVSLYLVLPVDKLQTHGRWLRLILTQTLRTISRQRRPPALPVLFLLDEMGTIGNLAMVEQSFGLMAGLGIRIWGFLQDLSQLKRDYPRSWETFWSNSSIVQVLNCGDLTTSEHVSKYLGTTTVNSKTGGWSYKMKPYPPGVSYKDYVRDAFVNWMVSSQPGYTREKAEKIANVLSSVPTTGQVEPTGANGKNTSDHLFQDGSRISWMYYEMFISMFQDLSKIAGYEAYTRNGYNTWDEDTQPASRPVLYPDEVRDSPRDASIIMLPGIGNYRLKRYEYFSHPVLSERARHDPNKPAPAVIPRPTPPPAPPTNAAPAGPPPPVAPAPPAPPVNDNRPPAAASVTDELAGLGKEMGKKAAGAAMNFLKDRLR